MKTKEELRREVELKKIQWENNLAKANEDRDRKERERKGKRQNASSRSNALLLLLFTRSLVLSSRSLS
jgi:hypothetical protein